MPRTVLLFILGNPGLLKFYVPFLDAIYHEANSSTSSSSPTRTWAYPSTLAVTARPSIPLP
ncbi:hypothetical protein BJY52DRAFT_1188502 [Lactarius psammicola]|nr:hypothetical protein BJY52DRAFT_1188502 [Lactarius psammicola]